MDANLKKMGLSFGFKKLLKKSLNLFTFLTLTFILANCLHHVESVHYPTTATKDEILQRHCTYAKGLHPNLIRFLTKEGYHREIEDVVEVTFTNSPLSPSDFKTGECKLALLAKFTRDMYVDPYEIQNIPGLAEDTRILNSWTDLEGPSWSAMSNSTVFIHLHSNPTGNLITTEILKFPVHFRYQKPLSHSRFKERLQQGQISNPGGALVNPAGYVKVIVPLPRLLLRCEAWANQMPLIEAKCHVIKTLCNSRSAKDELCEWISLPFKSNSKQGSSVFIPIGDIDQVLMVTGITLLVVLGGTAFLVHTLLRTSEKLATTVVTVTGSTNDNGGGGGPRTGDSVGVGVAKKFHTD